MIYMEPNFMLIPYMYGKYTANAKSCFSTCLSKSLPGPKPIGAGGGGGAPS